ncbi:MAG: Asp-tRNA(Asn)/Glu-tRNA(Gln) amidotransferase GatCAB subunit B [Phycisphaerae bacterium]|nr:Asp-tRNA(Asn)/Glu-tRNA(Gln) amidotransferase GatCAB subunit B [Phycisphaerae bacterium]
MGRSIPYHCTMPEGETQQVRDTRLIIGMEVHVELATRTKMFTRTPNLAHPEYYDSDPNTLVDPVVAALPGTLPVMNQRAVEMSMMVGLALNCTISSFSKWDRKNYYYPDLPKGYQISQYDLPLCINGAIEIPGSEGGNRRIGIIRAHLEEDTGKLGHELPGGATYDGSLVDLNRAGTPLLEIVTEPDFDNADDVVTFCHELRSICRFLGVTEGVMQRGHMRFEPNINVVIRTEDGQEHRTPVVEIKNLNSFRAVRGAIEHERDRQVQQWLADGRVMGPGAKSTRGWDDQKLVTVLQREKEDAHDYRYFPEPDLVPVVVEQEWTDQVRDSLPELPLQRRRRYESELGLSAKDALAIVDDRSFCMFFEEATSEAASSDAFSSIAQAAVSCSKLLLNAVAKRLNELQVGIDELGITPAQLGQLAVLRQSDSIGPQSVDRMLQLMQETDLAAEEIAREHDMLIVMDKGAMDQWIQEAIDANPQAADDVRSGKMAAIGRLVGHVMKASGGSANAKEVNRMLQARLRN